jgi:ubiquitin carboxyl-terminal hydrolase 47
LVHSGGAMGGHYYAYIYDHHSEKWFDFNDSSVREADVFDLVQMFSQPTKSKFAAVANAYMLMYRLADSTKRDVLDGSEVPDEIKSEL